MSQTSANESFDGNSASIRKANIRAVFGSGAGRLMVIVVGGIFALFLVIGAVKLFGEKDPIARSDGPAVIAPNAQAVDPMSPVSTAEGAKRAQMNNETAQQANAAGRGYIAPPVVTDRSLDQVASANGQQVGTAVLQKPQPVVVATPQPQVGGNGGASMQATAPRQPTEEEKQFQKNIAAQIDAVLSSAKGNRNGFVTVYASEPVSQATGSQGGVQQGSVQQVAGAAAQPGAAQVGGSQKQKDAFMQTGDTCYATLDNAIDSDDTLVVLATVHSCDLQNPDLLKGAKLVGKLEKAQDQVRVTFNKMKVPGVKTGAVGIEALAVTEDEARSGIGKDVDHHYFSRYFSLALASLLTGYGKAASMPTGTTVVTAGSTTVTNEEVDGSREAKIALGELGTNFGNEFKRDFNRPTTITSPRNMGIGVIFINDVFLK